LHKQRTSEFYKQKTSEFYTENLSNNSDDRNEAPSGDVKNSNVYKDQNNINNNIDDVYGS